MTALTQEQATKFELDYLQVDSILTNCTILKDFEHTSLLTLRKFDRNVKSLMEIQKEIHTEGMLINQRAKALTNEESALKKRDQNIFDKSLQMTDSGEELLPLREKLNEDEADFKKRQAEHNEATTAFNAHKYEVNLFTVPITEFPADDRTKFPKKEIQVNQQTTKEVETVAAFLGLIGTIIIE